MKKKLFGAIVSLVLAVVMMTSSSFAWFTVSTQADIKEVQVSMKAVKNIEIAKNDGAAPGDVTDNDSASQFTYGGKIDFGTSAYQLDRPATYDSGVKTVTYNDDGRTAGLSNAITGTFSATTSMTTYKDGTGDSDPIVAYGFNGYLRTNVDGTITATITPDGTNKELLGYQLIVKDGSNTVTVSATNTFSATANKDYSFELILYFSGANLQADDVASDLAAKATLTFTNSAI